MSDYVTKAATRRLADDGEPEALTLWQHALLIPSDALSPVFRLHRTTRATLCFSGSFMDDEGIICASVTELAAHCEVEKRAFTRHRALGVAAGWLIQRSPARRNAYAAYEALIPDGVVVSDHYPADEPELAPAPRVRRDGRVPILPLLRFLIFQRDEGICGICGLPVPFADFHVDHIWPVSRGGTNDPTNLQTSHSVCNIRKGASVR